MNILREARTEAARLRAAAEEIDTLLGEYGSTFGPANVAVVYRLALLVDMPPTRAVASQLGITQDAAAKRVQRAREAGFLASTVMGRKGC